MWLYVAEMFSKSNHLRVFFSFLNKIKYSKTNKNWFIFFCYVTKLGQCWERELQQSFRPPIPCDSALRQLQAAVNKWESLSERVYNPWAFSRADQMQSESKQELKRVYERTSGSKCSELVLNEWLIFSLLFCSLAVKRRNKSYIIQVSATLWVQGQEKFWTNFTAGKILSSNIQNKCPPFFKGTRMLMNMSWSNNQNWRTIL